MSLELTLELYKNLSGKSAVKGFKIARKQFTVYFNDGTVYVYDENSAGIRNIEAMKTLALEGQGLHSFIENFGKENYSLRLE